MSCQSIATGIVVCGVNTTAPTRRLVAFCGTCGRRRRMAQKFGGIWYGDFFVCLGCGEEFTSEGRMERPFRPGWREQNIAKGKRWWATALTPRQYESMVLREAKAAIA